MKLFVKMLTILLVFIFNSNIEAKVVKLANYEDYIQDIIGDFVRKIESEYDLHCYGSGGSMPNNVEKIDVLFISYQRLTVKEARKIEVHAIQELLKLINSHEKIRPYLKEYPFGSDRIHISISFRTETDDRPTDGSVALVSIVKNRIYYDRAEIQIKEPTPLFYMNEKNEVAQELVGGGPTEELIPLFEESFEEAVKIVEASSKPKKSI